MSAKPMPDPIDPVAERSKRTVEMSPEQIEQLEAEKRALLKRKLAEIPPAVVPAPRVHEIEEGESPLDMVRVTPPAPGELEALKQQIEANHAAHVADVEARDKAFEAEQKRLLGIQADLEEREQAAFDASTHLRLKATMAMVKSDTPGMAAQLLASKTLATEELQAALRERMKPARAQAREVRRLLKVFDEEYGGTLESIGQISRGEWLAGCASDGQEAFTASATYGHLWTHLEAIKVERRALEEALATDRPRFYMSEVCGGFEADLRGLIESAPKNGWTQEAERAFVWSLTRLRLATPESVASLVSHAKGVVTAAQKLMALKRGNIQPMTTIDPLPDPPKGMMEFKPTRGEDWDVFAKERS